MYLKAEELLERLFQLKLKGNLDGYLIEIEVEKEENRSFLLVDDELDRDTTDGRIILKAVEEP